MRSARHGRQRVRPRAAAARPRPAVPAAPGVGARFDATATRGRGPSASEVEDQQQADARDELDRGERRGRRRGSPGSWALGLNRPSQCPHPPPCEVLEPELRRRDHASLPGLQTRRPGRSSADPARRSTRGAAGTRCRRSRARRAGRAPRSARRHRGCSRPCRRGASPAGTR